MPIWSAFNDKNSYFLSLLLFPYPCFPLSISVVEAVEWCRKGEVSADRWIFDSKDTSVLRLVRRLSRDEKSNVRVCARQSVCACDESVCAVFYCCEHMHPHDLQNTVISSPTQVMHTHKQTHTHTHTNTHAQTQAHTHLYSAAVSMFFDAESGVAGRPSL